MGFIKLDMYQLLGSGMAKRTKNLFEDNFDDQDQTQKDYLNNTMLYWMTITKFQLCSSLIIPSPWSSDIRHSARVQQQTGFRCMETAQNLKLVLHTVFAYSRTGDALSMTFSQRRYIYSKTFCLSMKTSGKFGNQYFISCCPRKILPSVEAILDPVIVWIYFYKFCHLLIHILLEYQSVFCYLYDWGGNYYGLEEFQFRFKSCL